MVIAREEMQQIAESFKEPVGLNLGSHSALDAWQGQRNYGLRSIIYTTLARARIYLQNPMVGKKIMIVLYLDVNCIVQMGLKK